MYAERCHVGTLEVPGREAVRLYTSAFINQVPQDSHSKPPHPSSLGFESNRVKLLAMLSNLLRAPSISAS